MPRPKSNKERRGVHLTASELSKKFVEIYEKIPELRGKSPSHVASVAVEKLYKEAGNNPEEVRKFVRTMPASLSLVRVSERVTESGQVILDLIVDGGDEYGMETRY